MDSEMRDIPIIGEDQGEGWKDPIEPLESFEDRLQREEWKRQERLRGKLKR